MSSWSDLQRVCQEKGQESSQWLIDQLQDSTEIISQKYDGAVVICYASAFLQQPGVHPWGTSITGEDMNGFMNALYKAPTDRGLVLILHTPGGSPNAVESIVEYLHAKFDRIEVIVPYLAMSAGAMISLASDRLVLGRQSQLGPIDPQFNAGDKAYSARAIQEGFVQAGEQIEKNIKLAHLWAPILQNMGPSLIIEAEKALSYSKDLVTRWLEERMFCDIDDEKERRKKVERIAAYFNAEKVKGQEQIHVHGQRIGAGEIQQLGIKLKWLEEDQELQEAVLTAYHVVTLFFETQNSVKLIATNSGRSWIKMFQPPREAAFVLPG